MRKTSREKRVRVLSKHEIPTSLEGQDLTKSAMTFAFSFPVSEFG
jgi:hypothetical protein